MGFHQISLLLISRIDVHGFSNYRVYFHTFVSIYLNLLSFKLWFIVTTRLFQSFLNVDFMG